MVATGAVGRGGASAGARVTRITRAVLSSSYAWERTRNVQSSPPTVRVKFLALASVGVADLFERGVAGDPEDRVRINVEAEG